MTEELGPSIQERPMSPPLPAYEPSITASLNKPDAAGSNSVWNKLLYGNTKRAKLFRFIVVSLLMLLVLFIINGIIVGVSLHKMTKLGKKDIKMKSLDVSNLCAEKTLVQVQGEIDAGRSANFFLVNFVEPIVSTVSLPDAVDAHGSKLPKFLTLEVPPFKFGRGHTMFDFTDDNAITISFNKKFDLKYAAIYVLDESSDPLKKIQIKLQTTVETSSFWFPLSLDRDDTIDIEFNISDLIQGQSNPSTTDRTSLFVESVEITDKSTPNNFEVKVDISIPKKLLPDYFRAEIPKLSFSIGHRDRTSENNTNRAESINVEIEPLQIAKFTVQSQVLSPNSSKLSLLLNIDTSHKESLVSLLKNIRDGSTDFDLVFQGSGMEQPTFCPANIIRAPHQNQSCNVCEIQDFLSSLEVSKPYSYIRKFMSASSNSYASNATTQATIFNAPEIMSIGLFGVSQEELIAKFIFEAEFSKEFVSRAINYDISKLKGKIPPLALHNILESSQSKSILAKLDIEHIPDQLNQNKKSINFRVSIGFLDAFEASKIIAWLAMVGSQSPAQMMNEIVNYKRIYFKGIEDTLISSLASIYRIELPLGSNREKPDETIELNIPGYVFSAPAAGDPIVVSHHEVATVLNQTASSVDLKSVIKLNKISLMKNPTVRIFWDDLSIHFANPSNPITPLGKMRVQKGQFSVSLAPSNPIHLLHDGTILASIKIEGSKGQDNLILSWRSLLNDFFNSDNYTSVTIKSIMAGNNASMNLAIPPLVAFPSFNNVNGSSYLIASKYVKKSQLRVVGLRGATLQTLLKLSAMDTCPNNSKPLSSSISFKLSIPRIEANLCQYMKASNSSSSLAKVGVYPLMITANIIDLEFCNLKTQLLPADTGPFTYTQPESEPNDLAEVAKSNWIPLSASINDFEKLLETIDNAASNPSLAIISTCPESDALGAPGLLDKLIDDAGSVIKYNLPNAGPNIAPVPRPPILNFLESAPVKLSLVAESPNRYSMTSKIELEIPLESIPESSTSQSNIKSDKDGSGSPSKSGDESMVVVQWGEMLLEIVDGKNTFKVKLSQGQVEVRLDEGSVRLDQRSSPLSDEFTNRFTAEVTVNLDNENFNSGDLRRFIHNLYVYLYGSEEGKRHLEEKSISKRTVQMRASVKSYRSNTSKNKEEPPKQLESALHLKTLLSFFKVIFKRAGSRPSHLDDYWKRWKNQVEFIPNAQDTTVTFPCIIPSMCQNGLYKRPSTMSPLFSIKVTTFQFVQLFCETWGLTLGRVLSKLDLARHPRYLEIDSQINSDIIVASAFNDIDMVEAIIGQDQLKIKRKVTIIYPDEDCIEQSPIVAAQFEDIKKDEHVTIVELNQAEYYHDMIGLIHHISVDPIFKITLEQLPYYSRPDRKLEAFTLLQSPLNLYPSTERIKKSNFLSTLSCIVLAEMPVGSMINEMAGGFNLKVTSLPGTNSNTTELLVGGVSLPNPTSRIDLKLLESIIGTYIVRRDQPHPDDPPLGFRVAYGALKPVNDSSFPLLLEAYKSTPIDLVAHLSYEVYEQDSSEIKLALDPNKPKDREVISNFASRAALGKPFAAKMEVLLAKNVRILMDVDFPERDVELSFFDTQKSNIDPSRVNNFVSSIVNGLGYSKKCGEKIAEYVAAPFKWSFQKIRSRLTNKPNIVVTTGSGNNDDVRAGTVPQKSTNLAELEGGNLEVEDLEALDALIGNPDETQTAQTGGDLGINFALSLRNPSDFTMVVNSLRLELNIDDKDGILLPVGRGTDKILKGSLLVADRRCHRYVSSGDILQTLPNFEDCTRENPARNMPPGDHLLDNNRLLAPVKFGRKSHYWQALDEIIMHDGLCLSIKGIFSMEIMHGSDGKFMLALPLEIKKIPIPRFPVAGDDSTTYDPCFKLKQNSDFLPKLMEIPIKPFYFRSSIATDNSNVIINAISTSVPLQLGSSKLSEISSLIASQQVPLDSSMLYEFTLEFKSSWSWKLPIYPTSVFPGISLFWHSSPDDEAEPSVLGNGKYGYEGIINSLALGIQTYDRPGLSKKALLYSQLLQLLKDGKIDKVLPEKWGAVIPKNYLDRKLYFSLRYLSYDKKFILDVRGDGDDFTYHNIINLEKDATKGKKNNHNRESSLSALLGNKKEAWVGITANSAKMSDITLSDFSVSALSPDLAKTKVYWANSPCAQPGERGHFVIRLTDFGSFAMAKAYGVLRIKLSKINPKYPRSSLPNGPDGSGQQNDIYSEPIPKLTPDDPKSLLSFPTDYEIECELEYREDLALYDVYYTAQLPGRYNVYMANYANSNEEVDRIKWVKVDWSSIYVRHFW